MSIVEAVRIPSVSPVSGFVRSVCSSESQESASSRSAAKLKSSLEPGKPMLNIAFSGKRQHGKTTAADYLKRHHKYVKVSFAETLKDDAKCLFDFTDEHLYGVLKDQKFRNYDWTPREFMIKYGQFMRYFDENYWTTSLLAQVGLEQTKPHVIDDLRFPNEAALLKKAGFKLIRIKRYQKDVEAPYDSNIDTDISETALDEYTDWDAVIEPFQNTSKVTLYKTLDGLMKVL